MRMTSYGVKLCCAVAALLAGGCAHYPDNPRLAAIAPAGGYRYSVVRPPPQADKPFVLLAFSGGGTRAAAFSFGLMEALKTVEYQGTDGAKHRLLDDVEIISSVSGGSFTSAYYALFPDRFFADFPSRFLYRDIQGGLFWRLFNPYNWWRLASPDFSRIDMAAEYYNETIFGGKTFADLVATPPGRVPFLVLNATDISIAHRFEFTQDQFDLLCSDLAGVAVSRAVAASSDFPVAFAPLTLDIYQEPCGKLPDWIDLALDREANPKRRVAEAMAAKSYRDPDRRYAHLLDGGLSDNLGLRGPFQAVTSTDSPWSILRYANLKQLGRLLVIAANAKTTKQRQWDERSAPPGIGAVLDVVTSGPMDDVSFDSVEMIDGHFQQMQQLARTVDSCNKRLGQYCPAAPPVVNPLMTDFTFAELTFDDIPEPRLRRCLQELPTSFSLPAATVDLLRAAAGYLLMRSAEFVVGMQRLDPAWQPHPVTIDGQLVDAVCGAAPGD
ncbi:lipoprotein [Geotalea uraniireducens]|uniref:Lipoprotein n=1 Tax=Geotalea uraniireducens TaxID=351604 RepID=A0ABN6VXZ9_9BACT|nr:patatin-like phospholipase family protein [Geotalea uraniireducens]BDV44036.1 lipoprotein [Geotalea uraniireducens]